MRSTTIHCRYAEWLAALSDRIRRNGIRRTARQVSRSPNWVSTHQTPQALVQCTLHELIRLARATGLPGPRFPVVRVDPNAP